MEKQLILLSVLLVLGQPGLAENDGEEDKFNLMSGFTEILEKSAKEIEGGKEPLQALPTEDVLQAMAGRNKWKCDINPNRRKDCGYPGISKLRCSLRKCCFDPGKTGENRCYFSKVFAQSGFAETLKESAKEIKEGEQPLQELPIKDVLQVAGKSNWKCSISPFWRKECGYPGINKRECSNRKCCFDSGKTGSKRCYFSREHEPTLEELAKETEGGKESPQELPIEDVGQMAGCSISHKLRKDCGYPNISSEDCHSKGCCYDASIAGTVWCFHQDK